MLNNTLYINTLNCDTVVVIFYTRLQGRKARRIIFCIIAYQGKPWFSRQQTFAGHPSARDPLRVREKWFLVRFETDTDMRHARIRANGWHQVHFSCDDFSAHAHGPRTRTTLKWMADLCLIAHRE